MKKKLLIVLGIVLTLHVSAQTGLQKGTTAPSFSGIDNSGKAVNLTALLKTHKAVVLFFYRGQWCPYCNQYIKRLQDSLQLLTGAGAYVIGITPETAENISKTVDKTQASFSIIQDKGYKILKAYKVNYTVDDNLLGKLKGYGVDLEKNNGNTDHVLPVPATYIIGKSGKLIYVHFDTDYTKRPSVLALLDAIKAK